MPDYALIHHADERGGDVVGGDVPPAVGQRHYDALVACHAGDAACHAGIVALDDLHGLIVAEAAFLKVNALQMGALRAGGEDEGAHLVLADGQWRVFLGVGLFLFKMIVVERGEHGQLHHFSQGAVGRSFFGGLALVFLDEGGRGAFHIEVGFGPRDIGEDQVGQKTGEHLLAFACHFFHDVFLGHIGIQAHLNQQVAHFDLSSVRRAQDIPSGTRRRGIVYRHPFLRASCFGDDAGCRLGIGRDCFLSVE